MDNGEFEKISDRLRSCFCQFISTVSSYIHSQNFPNIKTYTMTKSTLRKFMILYQSRRRSKASAVFPAVVLRKVDVSFQFHD